MCRPINLFALRQHMLGRASAALGLLDFPNLNGLYANKWFWTWYFIFLVHLSIAWTAIRGVVIRKYG
jgi:hypothetical protein